MRHRSRKNHRTGIPTCHIALDTETRPLPSAFIPDSSVNLLRLGIAHYWRWVGGKASREETLEFTSSNVLWNWLFQKAQAKKSLWVWSHNLGFDLTALGVWNLLENGELSLGAGHNHKGAAGDPASKPGKWRGMLVTGDPPTILSVKTRTGESIRFVDTLNWIPVALAEIGELIGVKKAPTPGEVASDEDWLSYCKLDVEILKRCVQEILKVVREDDLGNLRCTVAAQSYAAWRHISGDGAVVYDDEPARLALQRDAYHGARHACYYVGHVVTPGVAPMREMLGVPQRAPMVEHAPVYKLDAVGAYPSIMLGHDYPVEHVSSPMDISPRDLLARMEQWGAVASVVLLSGNEPYPVRRNGGVSWRTGRVKTTLCGPELKRALQLGRVEIVEACSFYLLGRPFDEFVEHLWPARQRYEVTNNRLAATLIKSMLNSLHGKFAQRAFRWHDEPLIASPVLWGNWFASNGEGTEPITYRSVGGATQRKGGTGEPTDSFPLIAAYCVSYHRERMREVKEIAGERAVFYECADGIHVSSEGFDKLVKANAINPDRMGAFRVEQVVSHAAYIGLRHYCLDNVWVRPGLARKAWQDTKGEWHQTDFDRLDSMLSGVPPDGPLTTEKLVTDPSGGVDGWINPQGWVVPFDGM